MAKNRYAALQEERAELLDEADTLANLETPTPEQLARADAILSQEIPRVDGDLARLDRLREIERHEPAATPASRISVTPAIESDPWRGFRSAAEFGRAVYAAGHPTERHLDDRLVAIWQEAQAEEGASPVRAAPTNYHNEGHSADGYMVPPAMRDQVAEYAFAEDSLLALMDPEPTASNTVEYNRDETTPWGTTGVQANWAAEGAQLTQSRLVTNPSIVRMHKLHAYVLATEELLEDAPRLNSRLTRGAGRAIGWKAAEAITNGTGAGQPLGFRAATGPIVSQAKETSQTAATINANNVTKMFGRSMDPAGSVWRIHPDAFNQLPVMVIGQQPVWTPPREGMKDSPGGTLLGRPVQFDDHCQTLGTQGDIVLVSPMGYLAITKQGGVSFASSIHLFFDYDIAAFRWTFRLGGQPVFQSAVTPANGSITRSHFVQLDTRS